MILDPLLPLDDILDTLRDRRDELSFYLDMRNRHAVDAFRHIADEVARAAGFAD